MAKPDGSVTTKVQMSCFDARFINFLYKKYQFNNNNNNNNNNNFIYTVNYPISNTAGINGRTVFMNILTGIYSHICY